VFKNNRYIDKPPVIEIIGWVAIMVVFFWVLFYGFAFMCMGVSYLLGKPL